MIKEAYLWVLMIPFVFYLLGAAMNQVVIAANHRIMPVLLPICVEAPFDGLHRCMQPTDHLKWLADWITLVGVGMYSPGDFLVMLYSLIAPYCPVIWATLVIIKITNRRSECQ